MKKAIKRAVVLTLSLVLTAGAVVGCGKGGDQGAKLNGKSIMIYSQKNGIGEEWLRNAAKAYQEKTGTEVNVEFDAFLSNNFTETFTNEGIEVGDLYLGGTYEWAQWAMKDDVVADLTEFMNEKGEDGKSLNDRTTANYRYVLLEDGTKKQVFVPFQKPSNGLVYNIEMMDYICKDVLGWEEGHDYPVNTKELREVIAALETIQNEGTKKDVFTYKENEQEKNVEAFVWSGTVGMLEFFTQSWIHQYLGDEGMEEFYNQWDNCDMLKDDAFFIAYQEMCDLLDIQKNEKGEYYSATSIPSCISYNHTASQSQFLMNKALMCPTGSWFYTEMEATIKDVDNIGYMPIPWMSDAEGNPITAEGVEMPKNAAGEYLSVDNLTSTDFWVIPARSENQEEAKNFLRFIYSQEYMPQLMNDLQTTLAIEFDDSACEKSAWYEKIKYVEEHTYVSDVWTGSKLQMYSRIGYYYNPTFAPFSQLSMSQFGSSEILIDSATGKKIKDASEATGVAVTENVYKYVIGNHKTAQEGWKDSIKLVGGTK